MTKRSTRPGETAYLSIDEDCLLAAAISSGASWTEHFDAVESLGDAVLGAIWSLGE